MDRDNAPSHGHPDPWEAENAVMEDPEELRVIFASLDSFAQYAKYAHLNCTHVRRQAFYALPQAHWQMLSAPPFNYLATLDRADEAVESNADLARSIARAGLQSFCPESAPSSQQKQAAGGGGGGIMPVEWSGVSKPSDLDKARSTIRQFYRDWSSEGLPERAACHDPVFAAVDAERQAQRSTNHNEQQQQQPVLKVLVPGAGLGRLVFDLCLRGYHAEGNEISYHQLMASSWVLNSCERAGQHEIFPWIQSFSNHRSRADQFRSYKIPDIHPPTAMAEARAAATEAASASSGVGTQNGDVTVPPPQGVGSMQMSAADFLCLYGDDEHRETYDAVATVFFLDTAPNLIRYLEVCFRCLKPGGILINVGPLLWHWENNVPSHQGYDDGGSQQQQQNDDKNGGGDQGIGDPGSFELTDDEVMALVEKVGFVVEKRVTDIQAPYITDLNSMVCTMYKASHWVARKPSSLAT